MNIPENLLYTNDHEWILVNGNEAIVGVTDFAQHELGDIVYIEVDTVGEKVAMGETFGTIEAVKTVSDMLIPVDGEILEFNEALVNKPEVVNSDPYGEGWIVKIRIDNASQLGDLLKPADYQKLIEA
ncbi:MAG TPA: glycine cleavage system protein GcvH [Bacteroidales bacterium]|nr:glycine cleavage system protein GcvH [Bacteroidales bacterium]HPT02686.1 glycine cleavage system protein GcvH [Bacteroidales bacterium]